MEITRTVASCLYVLGVPALCMWVLIRRRKRGLHLPSAGRVLLVIGGFMSLATLATYIPMLPMAWQHDSGQFLREVTALAVWVLPSLALALLGWILRTPSTPTH